MRYLGGCSICGGRSGEFLDLNELDEGLDLGLEGLRNNDAPVLAELVTIESCSGVEESIQLVIESGDAGLDQLIGCGNGEESEVGLNVIVEGETVSNGENPVEHTAEL